MKKEQINVENKNVTAKSGDLTAGTSKGYHRF